MTQEQIDLINKVVWFIPLKNKRNAIRNFLNNIVESINITYLKDKEIIEQNKEIIEQNKEIKNKIINDIKEYNLIKVEYFRGLSCISKYMRNNPDDFKKEIDEFKCDMDEECLEYFNYYMNQLKYMPIDVDIDYIYFDNNSSKLFPQEHDMICRNEEKLYLELKKDFNNVDYIILQHLFFKSGIFYLKKDIIETFKNTICIDCGGYIGDTATVFTKYEFEKIYSFEVDIVNFNSMKKNLDDFGNNTIIPCHLGVGNENTTMEINYSDRINDGATLLNKNNNIKTYKVQIIRLDDYFKDRNNKIGLIKLDVEGFEESVLLGAEKIIREDRPVLLIACYHDWLSFGQMFRIKRWIKSLNLGYKILFRHDDYKHLLNWCLIAYPDQTRPDQTRPDQTRPEYVKSTYI